MITVLIVDDQQLVRSGFTAILNSQDDIVVVAEAANGREALNHAFELRPDVICMDIEMPVMNGIDASKRIRKDCDGATGGWAPKILILTTFGQESYVKDAIALGVDGFLLKTCGVDELVGAVRRIAHGGSVLGSEAAQIVMAAMIRDDHQVRDGIDDTGNTGVSDTAADDQIIDTSSALTFSGALKKRSVTEREVDILLLVVSGYSNAEIADQLFLGESTVKTHVSNLLVKLEVKSRTHLIIWAYNHGFQP